jgi:hypothetical protein
MVRTTMIDTSLDVFLANNSLQGSQSNQPTKWPLTHTGYVFDHKPRTISKTRPLILTYKSRLLETLDTLVYLPLYLLDWKKQKEILSAHLLDWHPALRKNSTFAIVEIDRIVNVNSAHLVWEVKWWGFRYFMYRYRMISFIIGTLFFWTVENIFMLSVAYVVFNDYTAERPERFIPPTSNRSHGAGDKGLGDHGAGLESQQTTAADDGPLTPAATPLPLVPEEESEDEEANETSATRRRPFSHDDY